MRFSKALQQKQSLIVTQLIASFKKVIIQYLQFNPCKAKTVKLPLSSYPH
jgi:hypothetical protein